MNESETTNSEYNRRDFLKGGSIATLMTVMGGVELISQAAVEEKPAARSDEPKVKVAVIGLGTWGREILDQLGRLPQAEIVALCDKFPAMVRRSSSKAPGAAQLEDYKAVLANKDIQAVIIATGTHQHKAMAVEALKAGKHVYCEAPLAHTIEEARAIALAARDAVGQVFQPGLQLRSDPQRQFLHPFIHSGALGKPVMARAQWARKNSWRSPATGMDQEKEINWRLNRETASGLVGEIGIHVIDQAGWFLNLDPVAVTGFGSTMLWKDDGREVPDTIQVVIEYAGGLRMSYTASLASSFEAEYELLHGSDATVMIRDGKAWMFKEVDSPLLGWEVYARKDTFYKETGIALKAGGSKQTAVGTNASEPEANPFTPLYYALESFIGNCGEIPAAVEDFTASFGLGDKKALAESLATIKLRPAATYREGYAATVLAIKANEAVLKGSRIELKKEMFGLA